MLVEEMLILLMRDKVNIEILSQHDTPESVTIVMRKRGKINVHGYSITVQPHILPTEEYEYIIKDGIKHLEDSIEYEYKHW